MKRALTMSAAVSAIALVAGLLSPMAVAGDNPKCKRADGDLSVVSNGDGTTRGVISHGGRLNGTTRAVFTSALTATPNPNAFSYTDEFSITTDRGTLKAQNVGLFWVSNGLFTEIAVIDSAGSTGSFRAATGVLYISGKTTDGGATFKAEITGEYCLPD